MAEKLKRDFCIECRHDTEYTLVKETVVRTIRDKEYSFSVTSAICNECGAEMSIPGLIDKNIREIDEQYRAAEGIVTVDDIEKLMKIYSIGKAPLSLALGFGEVTIPRYLTGQIPSVEYSDIIRSALSSPAEMKKLLLRNKEKLTPAAFNKAFEAATQMENLFSVSDKMLSVIAYVFECLKEVTPLALQKILYFTQGVHYALHDKPLFTEDCEAWVHGPVYSAVYDLFKDFKYNPIDDARFAVLDGISDKLTEDEKNIVSLVANTFGVYSGKTLERITHNETPWKAARRNLDDDAPSHKLISKDSIREYFNSVNEKYEITSESGLKKYINVMLQYESKNM